MPCLFGADGYLIFWVIQKIYGTPTTKINLRRKVMKYIVLNTILISLCITSEKEYFQQHVAYDIEVTLDDSAHTLNAYEKIIYTNNSPDSLDFIWFHLWTNAYKNTETALAKQRERFRNSSFIFYCNCKSI